MVTHPVDIYVGRRLKKRRMLLGLSQEEVGESVGVTFQQIQKYERGLNRIGSSRLYDFSRFLGVGVEYFFDGYNTLDADAAKLPEPSDRAILDFDKLGSKEVLLLVRAFNQIEDVNVRKRLLSLIRSISGTENEDDSTLVA